MKAHKGADPVSFLRGEVAKLNTDWPKGCQLMLDPLFITKGIKADKCKVMDSKVRLIFHFTLQIAACVLTNDLDETSLAIV